MTYDEAAAALLSRIKEFGRELPPGTGVSHQCGALVHGLPVYTTPRRLMATHGIGGRPISNDRVRLYVAQLPASELTVVDGVPVTSVARTVLDIARGCPLPEGLVTADAALRQGLSRSQLRVTLRTQWNWPRRPGAELVVRLADGRSESPLESYLRGRFIQLDLPQPELQYVVRAQSGEFLGRVDFMWDQLGLVGEADGKVKYTGDELWREKKRHDDIDEEGYQIIRWRWTQAHASDEAFLARWKRSAALALRRPPVYKRDR